MKETIPGNFDDILEQYAKQGYRVIALGSKKIHGSTSLRDIKFGLRDQFESNLTFQGLLFFENKLKDESEKTIKTLNECKLRTIMATGDNLMTAVSVGRRCGIVDGEEYSPLYLGDMDDDNKLSWKDGSAVLRFDSSFTTSHILSPKS